MRNARFSEVRCQKEVSGSKAPAASNMTAKVRRSRRVTDSLQADGVPFGGYKTDNRGVTAYRGQTHKYFKVGAGDCRLLVLASSLRQRQHFWRAVGSAAPHRSSLLSFAAKR